jgi:hypothetical protein
VYDQTGLRGIFSVPGSVGSRVKDSWFDLNSNSWVPCSDGVALSWPSMFTDSLNMDEINL